MKKKHTHELDWSAIDHSQCYMDWHKDNDIRSAKRQVMIFFWTSVVLAVVYFGGYFILYKIWCANHWDFLLAKRAFYTRAR